MLAFLCLCAANTNGFAGAPAALYTINFPAFNRSLWVDNRHQKTACKLAMLVSFSFVCVFVGYCSQFSNTVEAIVSDHVIIGNCKKWSQLELVAYENLIECDHLVEMAEVNLFVYERLHNAQRITSTQFFYIDFGQEMNQNIHFPDTRQHARNAVFINFIACMFGPCEEKNLRRQLKAARRGIGAPHNAFC